MPRRQVTRDHAARDLEILVDVCSDPVEGSNCSSDELQERLTSSSKGPAVTWHNLASAVGGLSSFLKQNAIRPHKSSIKSKIRAPLRFAYLCSGCSLTGSVAPPSLHPHLAGQ
jgi:hypothetical protein